MKEVVHIKSISEVHSILGIEKPKHPLVSILKVDSTITDFDFGRCHLRLRFLPD